MSLAALNINRDKSYWTPRRLVEAGESKGRPAKRLPGAWIDDLAALGKTIALCPTCMPKFNARAYNYTHKPNLPFVADRCDGCKQFHPRNRLFVPPNLVSNL